MTPRPDTADLARRVAGRPMMRIYVGEFSARQRLVGDTISFRARWDTDGPRRVGLVTRVTLQCIWVGAACYHWTDLVDPCEASR